MARGDPLKACLTKDQEEKVLTILDDLGASERLTDSSLFAIREGRFNPNIMIINLCKEKTKPGTTPKNISQQGRAKIDELRKIAAAVRKRKDAIYLNGGTE